MGWGGVDDGRYSKKFMMGTSPELTKMDLNESETLKEKNCRDVESLFWPFPHFCEMKKSENNRGPHLNFWLNWIIAPEEGVDFHPPNI